MSCTNSIGDLGFYRISVSLAGSKAGDALELRAAVQPPAP